MGDIRGVHDLRRQKPRAKLITYFQMRALHNGAVLANLYGLNHVFSHVHRSSAKVESRQRVRFEAKSAGYPIEASAIDLIGASGLSFESVQYIPHTGIPATGIWPLKKV